MDGTKVYIENGKIYVEEPAFNNTAMYDLTTSGIQNAITAYQDWPKTLRKLILALSSIDQRDMDDDIDDFIGDKHPAVFANNYEIVDQSDDLGLEPMLDAIAMIMIVAIIGVVILLIFA